MCESQFFTLWHNKTESLPGVWYILNHSTQVYLCLLVWEPLFWIFVFIIYVSHRPSRITSISNQGNDDLSLSQSHVQACVFSLPCLSVWISPPSVCLCLSVDGSSLSCTDHPGLHADRLKWTSLWAGWGNRWTGMMGRSHCMCVQLRAEQRISLIPEPIQRQENIQTWPLIQRDCLSKMSVYFAAYYC